MPMYVNTVTIGGYIGKDPELRNTQTGTALLRFTVATNEEFKGQQTTYWHSIVCWGKLADWAAQALQKGQYVTVVGALKPRRYKDKNGNWQGSNDINAMTVAIAAKDPLDEPLQEAMTPAEKVEDADLPF